MELIIKMVVALVIYDLLGWGLVILLSWLPWKGWDDGPIDTAPKPPPRKSFKERLSDLNLQSEKRRHDKIVKDNENRREIHGKHL